VEIELTDFKTKKVVDTLEVDACMVATGRAPYTNGEAAAQLLAHVCVVFMTAMTGAAVVPSHHPLCRHLTYIHVCCCTKPAYSIIPAGLYLSICIFYPCNANLPTFTTLPSQHTTSC
jgi:hypothetical protein